MKEGASSDTKRWEELKITLTLSRNKILDKFSAIKQIARAQDGYR